MSISRYFYILNLIIFKTPFFHSFIIILFTNVLQAQEATVKGRVIAADSRQPIEGVNVWVKGTNKTDITDSNGEYNIRVRQSFFNFGASMDSLMFTHAAFATQRMAITDRSRIDVILEPLVSQLQEVVVTGSAIGRAPKALSYAVGYVKEELLNTVPSHNIGSGLQGKIPGLRVNSVGGQPGQGTFFDIRGSISIANGQQPLIIVDGIFLNSGNLADLNPEDIERVEVLKGSAGTSIYGSQAANGVIQIFTKRGKNLELDETRITYRNEIGFSKETKRYDLNTFTNREILYAEGPQPLLGDPTAEGTYTTPLPNLQDYQESILFKNGTFQSHSLSVQGKADQTNFLASVERLRDEGILQNTDGYTRHAFRLNADHRVSDKFDLQISSMFSTSKQDYIDPNGTSSYLAGVLLITPIFDLNAANEENGAPYDWDIDNTGYGIPNPIYDRFNARQTVNRTRLLGNFTTNYYAKDWLTFTYAAALDRSTNAYEHFIEKDYLSTTVPGIFGTQVTKGVQNSGGGGIHRSDRISDYFTSRADIAIRKPFGGFNSAIRASFLYENLNSKFNDGIGENLAVSGIHSLDNARSNIFISSEEQEVVGYSGFLITDVDYNEKYIFSGLIRREGSSLFGSENQWANYYRASAAYRITEDVNLKFINELKLRASIGTSGLRPTYEQRFETFELINGVTSKNTLGNNFLQPALSKETEVGLNMTLWKGFELEANYSQIVTENQISLVPLSGAAGFKGQWRNAGTVEATVYEAALNIDFKRLFNLKLESFRWNVLTTFDRVEQVVTKLGVPAYVTGPGLQQSSLFLIEEGKPLGTMVGEVFAMTQDELENQEGIDPDEYIPNSVGYMVRKDELGTPDERPYKLKDERGNPLVQAIGDINPDFRMGFANFIGYKGFQIYTLFDWKKGGDIYNSTKQYLYRDGRDGDVAKYPDVTAGFFGGEGLYNMQVANNHFVEDGSFFMLREASISYNFTKLANIAQSLKVSLIGRNLFVKTKYSGFNPDVTSAPRDENALTNRYQNGRGSDINTPNGDPSLFYVDSFNYPLVRTVTFSLQVIF